MSDLWYLRLICCGRDDGIQLFDSWSAADDFRESYTSGPGVDPGGFGGSRPTSGHQRAAILAAVKTG